MAQGNAICARDYFEPPCRNQTRHTGPRFCARAVLRRAAQFNVARFLDWPPARLSGRCRSYGGPATRLVSTFPAQNIRAKAAEALCAWDNESPTVYGRVNQLKIDREKFLSLYTESRLLESKPDFVEFQSLPTRALVLG